MVEALTIVLAMGVTRGWRAALAGAVAAVFALAAIVAALGPALTVIPIEALRLVVGDRRPYVAALITLAEGVAPDQAEAEMRQVVDDVNRDLSRFEQIKRYTILPRDFTAEDGEVTPTLKLKRRVCQEHFAAEIEALYS